ncbi:MAG: tetratricopeptide repeat protein [Candidatus Aminicenantes bacterium]|nr:tetratricopeptide repeat protein [Candidatus Aminicenantes bacterium]
MESLRKKYFLFFLLFFFSASLFLSAQAGRGRGRISGTVLDEQGNPVPAVKITVIFLENENITRDNIADSDGKWKIGGLGTGNWRVRVEAEGYMPFSKVIYVRQLERNPPIDITLQKIEENAIGLSGFELFDKGNALFKEEKYEESIAAYKEFQEKNPEIFQVHFGLGNVYKAMKDYEQALKEFQLVMDKGDIENEKDKKVMAKALAAMGEIYLIQEDVDKAQEYFKQSLQYYPDDEVTAYNVGEIYFSHQQMDMAIEYFSMATKIKPDWSDAYLKLGYVYLNKAENDKALELFEKFLQLEPDTERSAQVRNVVNFLKK